MLVQRDVNDAGEERVYKELEVLSRADFNDALAQIVSELVASRLGEVRQHTLEQGTHERALTNLQAFEFLLDHAATSLVEAKDAELFNNLAVGSAQLRSWLELGFILESRLTRCEVACHKLNRCAEHVRGLERTRIHFLTVRKLSALR